MSSLVRCVIIMHILGILVSSCGFKPAYSNNHVAVKELSNVLVQPIDTIEGSQLYDRLLSLIPCAQDPKYTLIINVNSNKSSNAIQKNSDVVRQNITQKVQYQLFEMNINRPITSGNFIQTSSYNAKVSPYIGHMEAMRTTQTLSEQAAEKIRTRLMLFFASKKQ